MKTCPLCSTSWPGHHTSCPTDGATLIDSRELDPGTIIRGKYRIQRLLGRGGMGAVYLAEHILLARPRALKFISGSLTQDPAFLRRFRREALAAIELRHPNVVEVVDLDQAEDGSPYIAMEFVDGPDLRHALVANDFPPRAFSIARGIAQGLAAAHAKGIVHRDVKPENILLANPDTPAETPKLLDFGIAAVHETLTAVSRTHGLMLTPPYASPEQWRGLPADQLDGRADLYALGGVLYEMLTGQTPFHAHNSEGWMYQHLHEEPQPPSHLRPELANWRGLDALVLRLLAKDRELRPRDAAEMTVLLDDIYFDPHPSVPESPAYEFKPEPSQAPVGSEPMLFTNYAQQDRSRRLPRWLWVAGAAVVIAAAVGVWFILGSAQPHAVTVAQPAASQTTSADSPDTAATEQKAEALFKQKSYSKARPLFQAACNGNELNACSYLGYLYSEGLGGPKNLQAAREAYQKACDGGPQSSCYSLASLYVNAGDKAQARKYFQKACLAKVSDSCDLLNGLQ
jgi:serine/threonine-protein kinase